MTSQTCMTTAIRNSDPQAAAESTKPRFDLLKAE
jgi:hypothetical protein